MKQLKRKIVHHCQRGFKHLWDHVVPHEGNNHHPHLLKHRVLVGYSVCLVLLKVLAIVAPVALPSSSLYSSAITPQNIIDLTNQTRTNLNLANLSVSEKLMQAAAAKAQDMVKHQYFAHVSPSAVTPWSWMIEQGYKYRYAGENLAVHFTTAEGVQEGWLASPSHRANIVNKNYTEIGVGVANGEFEGYPTTFVVQMFGTPAEVSAQPVAAVTVPANTKPASPAVSQPAVQKPIVAAAEEPTTKQSSVGESIKPPVVAEVLPKAAPALDESSVRIVQHDGFYEISLRLTNASSAAAYLGNDWQQLAASSTESNLWQGRLAYDSALINQNGEQLAVVATAPDQSTARFVLAWVAPNTKTQNFYTFNEGSDRYAKLFGFLTIHNLDDSVRRFYFFFMVFLAAALLINILVRIRIQRLSVIGHTVFVLGLTVLLMIV